MPQKDKQQRRNRRRTPAQPVQPPPKSSSRWQIFAGAGVVLVVAAILVGIGVYNNQHSSPSAAAAAQNAPNTAPKIDGFIGCNTMEQITYHVHAHLTVMNHGKNDLIPLYSGLNYNHDCLYWLHVHDQSGIIHIESPHKIVPTLGAWYDVVKSPLSATQVASAKLKASDQMKIWVAENPTGKSKAASFKPYTGNPRNIKLYQHTQIWIDVGPPYVKPKSFDFAKYGV
jgi:hypothetical protein